MENTLNIFKSQQERSVELLAKLLAFLDQGEAVGISIDPALKNKLKNAIDSVAGEKLKVALIGGFSEGKTSIAAAWMQKLDKSSMKISHQESSNEVKIYEVDNNLLLIDTPGLFGFKEQINAETNAVEKYKDITKKYVSGAHLVLYVMNSTNPIKESHQEDLVWLFRTLNLLPRTVFVLSRFDEVADVEDEGDYLANLKIKQNNVIGRLRELVGLNETEVAQITIVGVAANPFDLGFDHWLSNINQFKTLSHIDSLQSATTEKIRSNGGSAALVSEMHNSVIRDVLNKQLPIAIENDQKISLEVSKLNELKIRSEKQLESTRLEIEEVRRNLISFVERYFTELIMQAKGSSLETFGDFFEREVGSEGIVLATRLQNEFSRQTDSITLDVAKMQLSFDTEINHFNANIRAFGKQGVNYLLKGNLINNTTVLAARDTLVSAGKIVGMELGSLLKFKPWGAMKFAKGANGALAFIGVAFEAWDSWEQYKREEAFNNSITKMVQDFEKQRKELISLINADQFKEQFFGKYLELKGSVAQLQNNLKERNDRQQRFHAWRVEAETIDVEFKRLS
ncbi:MAG: hypothetical protein RLZZ352_1264 [Pseudomonadota bacterium]|jgi:GTP-binding protein EngB required for normal cell division